LPAITLIIDRQVFSSIAIEHIQNPRNVGQMVDATHYGVAGEPGEGPFVQLWFRVEGSVIEKCQYKTYGCPTSIASASLVAELLKGKTIEIAKTLDESDIRTLLAHVPEGKEDCPGRVITAIQIAFEI
jgi:nitrogen fixation NifU-like protein